MREHCLKTWPAPYQAVIDGAKRHEVRVNDRGFAVGDRLVLAEYEPHLERFTGRQVTVAVLYMTESGFGLPSNLCVMSIEVVDWSMANG